MARGRPEAHAARGFTRRLEFEMLRTPGVRRRVGSPPYRISAHGRRHADRHARSADATPSPGPPAWPPARTAARGASPRMPFMAHGTMPMRSRHYCDGAHLKSVPTRPRGWPRRGARCATPPRWPRAPSATAPARLGPRWNRCRDHSRPILTPLRGARIWSRPAPAQTRSGGGPDGHEHSGRAHGACPPCAITRRSAK